MTRSCSSATGASALHAALAFALVLGGQSLTLPQQRVAAEGGDDAHSAPERGDHDGLIVCSRFSASSNTIDAGDSKTSSVTSSASRPYSSNICFPTVVSVLWKAAGSA